MTNISALHQPRRRRRAVRRLPRRDRPALEQVPSARSIWRSSWSCTCITGFGITVGLSPPAHAPGLPDEQAGRVRLRDPGLDGRPGAADRLGRRPPQAPRPHRRGGRSAQPARRPGLRPARACGTPTSAGSTKTQGSRRVSQVRARPLRGQRHALDQPQLPRGSSGSSLLIPFVLGFVLHGFSLTAALWTLLWAGFVRIFFIHHVDVVDQLRLPLLRHAAASTSRTSRRTSPGSRSPRSASPGTTTTTPSRARRARASGASRSTSRRCSSARWRGRPRHERRADHARAPAREARRREAGRARPAAA